MIQSASSPKDIDMKMIYWCVGAFLVGIAVGAFVAAPAIQKIKNKKKTETPPAKA
jgi:hypothetical protein